MVRKSISAKLAIFLTAVALMFGSFFGKNIIMNTSALAEEIEQQTETEPQTDAAETACEEAEEADLPAEEPAAEETISPETGEIAPQTAAEEEPAVQETEEAVLQTAAAAEEPAAQEAEEAAPQAAETQKETVPQEAEEAAPQAEETREETAPQAAEEAGHAEAEEAAPEPERKAEPEGSREDVQPEAPSGKDASDEGHQDELVFMDDHDAGSVSEELLEPFNDPAFYEDAAFAGTAEIKLMNEGMLHYGDEIILKADVRDVHADYRLVWEANDSDDRGWYAVAGGEEYRFILNRENVEREYRVVVYTVD